eukprot:SAG11_NODE_22170_length_410_cov_15.302251_1_plen_89_part_10
MHLDGAAKIRNAVGFSAFRVPREQPLRPDACLVRQRACKREQLVFDRLPRHSEREVCSWLCWCCVCLRQLKSATIRIVRRIKNNQTQVL